MMKVVVVDGTAAAAAAAAVAVTVTVVVVIVAVAVLIAFVCFQLRNVGANLCVDTKYRNGNERFGLEPCTKDHPGLGGEQVALSSLVRPPTY